MQVKSAIGGHWEIDSDGYFWDATHSSYVPDVDAPYFHQHTSARTLEDLYVAIGELEADAVETYQSGGRLDSLMVEGIERAQRLEAVRREVSNAYGRAAGEYEWDGEDR